MSRSARVVVAWLAGAWLVLLPAWLPAQSITPLATPNKSRIRLSESIQVTLTFEGPTPLRVQLPNQLLTREADLEWRIRPLGPATVTPVPEARERWSQVYRLDPYVPGNSLLVGFAPVKVNDQAITPPGFRVAVDSTVPEAKIEAARPVTGIEELPPPLSNPVKPLGSWVWVAVILGIAFLALLVWYRRRPAAPAAPEVWARSAFDRLERSGLRDAPLLERVSAILREYIEQRFGIPAPRLTTAELLATPQAAGWAIENANSLRRLLEVCDRAKFAGDIPDDDGCGRLLAAGRSWIDYQRADTRPR